MNWRLKSKKRIPGKDLIGNAIVPPFDYYHKDSGDQKLANSKKGGQQFTYRVASRARLTS